MAQRNYLINTTTLSLTANGTTIGSGNTQAAGPAPGVLARTLVRTGLSAGELLSGSQTWAIHYVVSAMATPYSMSLRLVRQNSSGVAQATSDFGASRTATGTYDDNLTWDAGTWGAGDQLALEWWHFRPSGTGNKNATIDANGASYVDAPQAAAIELVIQNATHAHSSENVVLTQAVVLRTVINSYLHPRGGLSFYTR